MARRRSGRKLGASVSVRGQATKESSRKRTRLKLKWGPIFWALLVIQVIVGLGWSLVTSPRVIYVRDSESFDRVRIQNIIQVLKGHPFFQVPARRIEGLVANDPSIKECEFTVNIFGRGSLNIKRRTPVARLEGYKNVYLNEEGVVFVIATEYKMLPLIKLAENLRIKSFTLSGVWESQKSAQVCIKLSKWFPNRPFVLEVDGRGLISLDLQGITHVFLGSFEEMDEKFDVLHRWLEKDENFLRGMKMFNLSVPKFPTYVPR